MEQHKSKSTQPVFARIWATLYTLNCILLSKRLCETHFSDQIMRVSLTHHLIEKFTLLSTPLTLLVRLLHSGLLGERLLLHRLLGELSGKQDKLMVFWHWTLIEFAMFVYLLTRAVTFC